MDIMSNIDRHLWWM